MAEIAVYEQAPCFTQTTSPYLTQAPRSIPPLNLPPENTDTLLHPTRLATMRLHPKVKLRVYIPELRYEEFEFRQVPSAGDPGALRVPGDGVSVDEPLELQNFPLDTQRLHVECQFELDDEKLGLDRFGKQVTRKQVRVWTGQAGAYVDWAS
eukprot:165969-Chlamydomonas_euryale.AAC.1